VHCPDVQTRPVGQVLPHLPQFALLDCTSTQTPPQLASPATQTQAPLTQL
jgi:hypothetical protein